MAERFEQDVRDALASLETHHPAIDLVAAAERRARDAQAVASPRRWLWLIPVCAALVALILISLPPRNGPPGASPPNTDLIAVSVSGSAWADDGQHRRQLREGERLRRGEQIETGDDGKLVLLDHGANVVDVRATTRIHFDASVESTDVAIDHGVLRVSGVNRVALTLASTGGSETFHLDSGLVGLAVSERGGSLAVLEGEVLVEGPAGTKRVVQGRQWLFGQSSDTPLPTMLTLKVDQLGDQNVDGASLVVSGTTQPGALVSINGQAVDVDARGAFRMTVTGIAKKQTIIVRARDAEDRQRELAFALRQAPTGLPRERRIQTRWRWEPTPG